MDRDITVIDAIQAEKEKDIAKAGLQPLDPEGRKLAEHKRFTFDIVDAPADPLR